MNRNSRNLLFAAGAILAGAAVLKMARPYPALETVPEVDLERYAGKWYEIAALPQRFQKGCRNTSAEYKLHPEGYVEVYNSCLKDGQVKDIHGKAVPVAGSRNSKLKVQFFPLLKGDYWILDLATDYSYALVGAPDRKSLWILAREPQLSPVLIQNLTFIAQAKGFDTTNLRLTEHKPE